jgi:hypothetical protein
MVSNGSERSETAPDDYRLAGGVWPRPVDDPDYCGGLYGVAVVWFAAGLMVAALMIAIWLVT